MERTCGVAGCAKPPRSGKAELCKMHYHRWYRHGDVDVVATGQRTGLGRRYRNMHRPGHPLAGRNGHVYEHRYVLFELIGYGPHLCHWCNAPVTWSPKGTPSCLQVDHLSDDGADNRPENLVPSCRDCNATRALQARSDRLRARGWWARNDTVAVTSPRRPRVA